MQLEFMQLRAQAQETQQKLQAVVKRMNDAILAAAGSTPNLSFNQDNLTFSETVASGPRPVPINEHRD